MFGSAEPFLDVNGWPLMSFRFVMHLSMLSPRGGTPGICGAFDFSEDFLVKVPTVGPQNWVK